MSVELEPGELRFRRPFTSEVSQVLVLKNPNADPVAFKVKTTAPKQYCVRPNSGRIESNGEVKVQVLLQAMKEDPPPEAKCRDKFLVQSVAVTADKEFSNVAALWQQVDKAGKSSVHEQKIRVVYLPAENPEATPNVNGSHQDRLYVSDGTEPPAHRSPSPEAVTPHHTIPVGPVSKPESRPTDAKNRGEAVASAHNPAWNADDTLKAVQAAPKSTDTFADVKAQLEQAQVEIKRLLKEKSEQGGLRQRKADGQGVAGAALSTIQTTTEGVPVQIVAALCLLSFLLAYLFF